MKILTNQLEYLLTSAKIAICNIKVTYWTYRVGYLKRKVKKIEQRQKSWNDFFSKIQERIGKK